MTLTKINDLTGNYRVPAGITTDVLEATLAENDELLLRDIFDDETATFILANENEPPATTLINGGGGLHFCWKYLALHWYFARTNFAIIGWQFDQKSYLTEHYSTYVGNLEKMRNRLKMISEKYWNTTGKVIDTTQRIILINAYTIEWLRVGTKILFDGNEATITDILPNSMVKIDGTFALNLNETKNFVVLYKLRKKVK